MEFLEYQLIYFVWYLHFIFPLKQKAFNWNPCGGNYFCVPENYVID